MQESVVVTKLSIRKMLERYAREVREKNANLPLITALLAVLEHNPREPHLSFEDLFELMRCYVVPNKQLPKVADWLYPTQKKMMSEILGQMFPHKNNGEFKTAVSLVSASLARCNLFTQENFAAMLAHGNLSAVAKGISVLNEFPATAAYRDTLIQDLVLSQTPYFAEALELISLLTQRYKINLDIARAVLAHQRPDIMLETLKPFLMLETLKPFSKWDAKLREVLTTERIQFLLLLPAPFHSYYTVEVWLSLIRQQVITDEEAPRFLERLDSKALMALHMLPVPVLTRFNVDRLLSDEMAYLFTDNGAPPWSGISSTLMTQQVLDEIFFWVKQNKSREDIVALLEPLRRYSQAKFSALNDSDYPFQPQRRKAAKECLRMGKMSSVIEDYLCAKEGQQDNFEYTLQYANSDDVKNGLIKFSIREAERLRGERPQNQYYIDVKKIYEHGSDELKNRILAYRANLQTAVVYIVILGILFFPSLVVSIPLHLHYRRKQKAREEGVAQGKAYVKANKEKLLEYMNGRSVYDIGMGYADKNDYDNALLYFTRITSNQADYSKAMIECGRIALSRNDEQLAATYFEKAGEDKLFDVGLAYKDHNRDQIAFDYFLKIPADHKDYHDARVQCGQIELSQAKYTEAAVYFGQAGEGKTYEIGLSYRGYVDESLRRVALLYFSKVPEDHEHYSDAMVECASIHMAFSNRQLAAEYYRKAGENELAEAAMKGLGPGNEAVGRSSDYGSQGKYSPQMHRPTPPVDGVGNNNNNTSSSRLADVPSSDKSARR